MDDFLSFRKMITPLIIKILFWVGVGLSVIGGLGAIIAGASAPFGGGAIVLMGLLTLVLGPVFVRIYCELLILAFRIYEELTAIRGALTGQAPPQPAFPVGAPR